ncbi:MAG: hypothetical protein ACYDH6_06235 [Acidimicrobiales bacterium]
MAAARDGVLTALSAGRTRSETIDALRVCGAGTVIGLDFSFSFPRWWIPTAAAIDDVWDLTAGRGEEWLAACPEPFWGRPGRPCRLAPGLRLRRTEQTMPGTRSIFQIGGAGSVGSGSIRGMPELARLRAMGMAVWPFDSFDRTTRPVVAEVWPRACMGTVVKSRPSSRADHLRALVDGPLLDVAVASDDAFDAACAAIAMSCWDSPTVVLDEVDRIEGRILVGVGPVPTRTARGRKRPL